jgi:hypothetical protein
MAIHPLPAAGDLLAAKTLKNQERFHAAVFNQSF